MTPDNKLFIETEVNRSLGSLLVLLTDFVEKQMELERLLKVAFLLLRSGVRTDNSVFAEVAKRCLIEQKADGGFIDVEDSAWAVAFLKRYPELVDEYKHGLIWLRQRQLESGGWGKNERDTGRIPITGVLLYLLPELANIKSLRWIEKAWKEDYIQQPALTYKAAFSFMALKTTNSMFSDQTLFKDTEKWLESQQNDDLGWGPWRGHPVGSSPFCTGVALVGLLQYPNLVDKQVIVNGLEWIQKKQLPGGLWSDHYIEEGSAWCFYALTEGYRFLKRHP